MDVICMSNQIKKDFNKEYRIDKFYIIGNFSLNKSLNHEIDYVAIVEDNVELLNFVINSSIILKKYIDENNIYIQCFPIHKTTFEGDETMFIQNIKLNGREI